jgi:hypothetical protein
VTLRSGLSTGRAEDQTLLVGGEGGGGEVGHGGLLAAQVPSAGEEVKASGCEREHPPVRP